MTITISAKLTLAVRLLDTTTGREISEPDAHFLIDGMKSDPMRKGDGMYVFVNVGKEDFLMQTIVRGYDNSVVAVSTDKLDQRLPMLDLFLMPSEKNRAYGDVLKVYGTLSKLDYIEAINLNRPIGLFHSSQDKKEVHKLSLLPMTAGGGVSLDTLRYALLNEESEIYEPFKVLEQDTTTTVITEEALRGEHKLNDRIFRIIYGNVEPDGSFVLKVRDDAKDLPHLLHFEADGKEYFRKIDFHLENEEIDLLKGAVVSESKEPTTGENEE